MESLNKKKNALDFAIFLREIGYASTARGQDFEWLFDYPSTRPFLKLLSTSISGTTNVLSTEEVSQYAHPPPPHNMHPPRNRLSSAPLAQC
jgi:hypothetical protein